MVLGVNNGPNPRDCATCSMNGHGNITTVTWDKANILYAGTLPCEVLLVETKDRGPYERGFKVSTDECIYHYKYNIK